MTPLISQGMQAFTYADKRLYRMIEPDSCLQSFLTNKDCWEGFYEEPWEGASRQEDCCALMEDINNFFGWE